jgi:hypothetical protein
MDALMLPGYPRFLGGCPLLAIVAALLIVWARWVLCFW